MPTNRTRRLAVLIVVSVVLTAILTATGVGLMKSNNGEFSTEMQFGIFVVEAIATLMTVLFALAVGYAVLQLADGTQALGLPEGSIRAMIALILIMVFVILSVFLFRKVGEPSRTYLGAVKQMSDVKVPDGWKLPLVFESSISNPNDHMIYVYVAQEPNDESKRLAHQLLTTLGTLVVSIASFYFGNTMATSARRNRAETTPPGSGSGVVEDGPTAGSPLVPSSANAADQVSAGQPASAAATAGIVVGGPIAPPPEVPPTGPAVGKSPTTG